MRQYIHFRNVDFREDHNAEYRAVELCYDAADYMASSHKSSLSAILRILDKKCNSTRTKPHLDHLPDSPRKQDSPASNDFTEASTVADYSVDGSLSTATLLSPEKLVKQISGTLESGPLSKKWSQPRFLKGRRLQRRYSGDFSEYASQFKLRWREGERRARRRKSSTEESIENVTWQELQATQIENSSSQPQLFDDRVYRRCRSARMVEDVVDWGTSLKMLRRGSLLSSRILSSGGEEIWPEFITSSLSGGQSLIDRYILFEHIEGILSKLYKSPLQKGSHCQTSDCSSERRSGLKLWSAGISIPRPNKLWGGEDAFFVCDESDGFVGAADGVGEWGELGCNPRQFAEELMEGARQEALQLKYSADAKDSHDLPASVRAKRVLGAGFYATQSYGASTAIVAGLNHAGSVLGIANIGDSSCILLRRDRRHHRQFIAYRRTKEQQHFFNCPYQLVCTPPQDQLAGLALTGMHDLARALSNFKGGVVGDSPDMADLYDIHVQEGDILITATDGLFDNLFDQEIANLVSLAISTYESRVLKNYIQKSDFINHPSSILPPKFHPRYDLATPPQDIARALAEAAFYRSVHPRARVPFSMQSRRACDYHQGGKMDDITVIVSWIT